MEREAVESLSVKLGEAKVRGSKELALEYLCSAKKALKECGALASDEIAAVEKAEAVVRRGLACGRHLAEPSPYKRGYLIEICTADELETPLASLKSVGEFASYCGLAHRVARKKLYSVWSKAQTSVMVGQTKVRIFFTKESRGRNREKGL